MYWTEYINIVLEIVRPAMPFFLIAFLGCGAFACLSPKNAEQAWRKAQNRLLAEKNEQDERVLQDWEERQRQKEQKRILDQIYK